MRLDRTLLSSDLYAVLGVSARARRDEIRRAYRRLARASHPDRDRAEEAVRRMAQINVAASVLCDPALRAAYDAARPSIAHRLGPIDSGPCEWVVPRRPARVVDPEFAARIRDQASRILHQFGAWTASLSPRQHFTFLLVSVALATAVLGLTKPKNLISPDRPAVASARGAPAAT